VQKGEKFVAEDKLCIPRKAVGRSDVYLLECSCMMLEIHVDQRTMDELA